MVHEDIVGTTTGGTMDTPQRNVPRGFLEHRGFVFL